MRQETIKSIRDADNGVIQEAKTLLIQRIFNLLSTFSMVPLNSRRKHGSDLTIKRLRQAHRFSRG